MQFEFYDKLCNGLTDYIYKNCEYKPQLVKESPNNPQYPLIVFTEVRNLPINGVQSIYERKVSLGYRADIFAEAKGGKTKTEVCKAIAKSVQDYLVYNCAIQCVSYNINESLSVNGKICQIVMTFNTSYLENKAFKY